MARIKQSNLDYVKENWECLDDFRMATNLNVTETTIRNYRRRLGLVRNIHWTQEHTLRMMEMHNQGLTARQIGEVLGTSKRAVQQQMFRMAH